MNPEIQFIFMMLAIYVLVVMIYDEYKNKEN
jgi:hypothetical protein